MTTPLRFLIVGVVVCYIQFPLLWTLLGLSTHIYESP